MYSSRVDFLPAHVHSDPEIGRKFDAASKQLNAEFKLIPSIVSAGFNTFCHFHPSIDSCFGKLLLELFDLFGAALTFLLRILKACICRKPNEMMSARELTGTAFK